MRNIFFVTSWFALSVFPTFIKGQTWQWAREESATNGEGQAVCSDYLGNVYTAGGVNGLAIVGSNTFAAGNGSALIVKYDQNGNVLWANACPGYASSGYGVACD